MKCHVVVSIEESLALHLIPHVVKQRREFRPAAYPSYHALRARKDLAHLLHLVVPLGVLILIDTQGINP